MFHPSPLETLAGGERKGATAPPGGALSHPGVPPSVLDELAGLFTKTRSQDDNECTAAKQRISGYSGTDFALALLALAGSANHEDAARLDASVHFSDILLRRWPSSPDVDDDGHHFTPIIRAIIKSRLCNVFIHAPPCVQAQLAEALGAAAAFDPVDWAPPVYLSIIECLSTTLSKLDFGASIPLLAVFSSLFSHAVHLDPAFPLQYFADFHVHIFRVACTDLLAPGVTDLRPTFELLRLCCEIFYCLKSVHFPDYFKDRFSQWEREFRFLAAYRSEDVEENAALAELQIVVLRILQLYIERFPREMGKLNKFLSLVKGLFLEGAADRGCLVPTALKFFTAAIQRMHMMYPDTTFFKLLLNKVLCDRLVDMLRPQVEDEVLFYRNPMEYIKCDSEGSDADTQRWAACKLLRVLLANSWDEAIAVVLTHVKQTLYAYAAGQAKNWKETYVAIYLVIALMNEPGETEWGDIHIFIISVILPELKAPDWKSEPMLKAAVLRFLNEFMHEIAKANALGLLPSAFGLLPSALGLLPSVVRFLVHESIVVRSYAATFIENLLIIKDLSLVMPGVNTVTSYHCFVAGDISPYAPEMVQNLSTAICFPDSLEDPCIMKCLMRVLGMANIAGPTAHNVTSDLVGTLIEVCNGPKDSDFSYCLFEALAAVIGQADGHDLALLTIFEANLSPLLWRIMDKGITQFWPYAIQIWAQLVDFSQPPLSLNDKKLFGVLVSNVVWDRPSCVPAMVCLLRAFFLKFPDDLHQAGMLQQFLQLCCDRLKEISSEDSAIKMLSTLVETVSKNIMGQYMVSIWSVLFDRARSRRVAEYLNSIGLFMSLVVERYGLPFLVTSTNNVSRHILDCFLSLCWIPNLKLIKGALRVKQAVVFSTKLLCTYQGLLSTAAAPEVWGKLLDSTISLLDQDGAQKEKNDGAGLLQHSRSRGYDLLSYVEDPKKFLVTSLATLSAEYPGRFLPIIQKYVNQVNLSVFLQLCTTHNASIT